ncbi:MAG TPA: VOC family protein [Bryobacteraceae bacterium]|jgi:catechol-2,3-dioxygenase|nr:VOC family protein [Bryobacteraceae bacterium]
MPTNSVYPRAITPIGVTVVNTEKAIQWYQEILDFQSLVGALNLVADDSHFGQLAIDIWGSGFGGGRLSQLTGANGVCLELFEFSKPATAVREKNFEYWKTGIYHFAIVDPAIEDLARRITEAGGKCRTRIWTFYPGKPYKIAYCEDPFGNIIEIYSHSTEQIWSNLL